MKILFADINIAVIGALEAVFAQAAGLLPEGVEIDYLHGDLTTAIAPGDGIMTPGNAFGLMDGGIDKVINLHFDGIPQRLIQQQIAAGFAGMCPVGGCAATVVGANVLIYAPTMTFPAIISGSPNVFAAARAGFNCALRNNLKRVLCPGFGTLSGGVNPSSAACQMRLALLAALKPPTPLNWHSAKLLHLTVQEAVRGRIVSLPGEAPIVY